MDNKKCSCCGVVKSLELFNKRKNSIDGYRGKCKECIKNKKTIVKDIVPKGFKKCIMCHEIKDIDSFGLNNANLDKLQSICFSCYAKKRIAKGQKPTVKNTSLKGFKTCTICEKTKPDSQFLQGRRQCRSCRIQGNKDYSLKNKERLLIKHVEYRKDNKEYISLWKKEYRNKNREHVLAYNKKYLAENRETLREKAIIYERENKDIITKRRAMSDKKRRSGKKGKLKGTIRSSVFQALKLKGYTKKGKTKEYVGCSYEDLILHFNKGQYGIDDYMKKNKGESLFHIDHIIPTSYFMKRFSDETELEIKAKWYNYRNLRIWPAIDNIVKSDKLDMDLIREYGIEDLLMD